MEEELKGQVSNEQIEKWKKQFGEVYAVTCDGSVCYLKKPSRVTLSAMSQLSNDPIKSAEFLLNNCWLDGDKAIKEDDEMFLGVVSQLGDLVKVKAAKLEKL